MCTSWLALLLSCGIVLQLAVALPQQDAVGNVGNAEPLAVLSEDEQNDLNSARRNLLLDTLDILANQSSDILLISNTLITNLVRDLKAQPNKPAEIDEYIKRFVVAQQHIESIDFDNQPEQMEKIFLSVDELGGIFYDIELLHKKGEGDFLEAAFERIGAENMDARFNNTMQHALSDLSKLFRGFENSLNAKERVHEQQLIDWFQRFNDEEEIDEKLGNLMEQFFKFFE